MHPPLERPHPDCQDVIKQLNTCHETNPFAKFIGSCNSAKAALDQCFRMEKEIKRRKNFMDAKSRKSNFEKAIKDNQTS